MTMPCDSEMTESLEDLAETPCSFDDLVRRRADAAIGGKALGGMAPAECEESFGWNHYASLAGKAAAYLEARGIGPGDRVAIWGQTSFAWAVWLAAAAWRGACLVAIHPNFGADQLSAALRQSSARWLIADETARGLQLTKTANQAATAADLDGVTIQSGGDGRLDIDSLLKFEADRPTPEGSAGDPLCIQFTSGSTGLPKAVMLSHQALIANAALTAKAVGIKAGDRIAAPLPLFHSAGVSTGLVLSVVADAWWVGFHRFEARVVLRSLSAESCTVIQGVPTMYAALLEEMDQTGFSVPSLRLGIIGGSFLPPKLCKRVADRMGLEHLGMVYGQTECGPTVSVTRGTEKGELAFSSAGPPLDGVSVRIADSDTGQEMADGKTGEIQVSGPTMMSGYFGDPAATSAAYTVDGWLRTGDLGRLADGCLQVTARLKELIIRGGENISPYEVEEGLRAAASVADICAVPAPSAHWGEEICAVLVALPGQSIDVAVVQAHAQANLPRHMRPDRYAVVDAMPLLANGKIDRLAVKALMGRGEDDG